MKTVDLHTHSNKSDGTLTPAQLVRAAYGAGLAAVALTDHDTAEGLEEAMAAANTLDGSRSFEFIPGIELSVSYMDRELHIVGLYLDTDSSKFLNALKALQHNRDARNEKMIARMNQAGIDITMEKLRQDQGGGVLTRANFASYLLHVGVITSIQEGFDKYLDRGKPFYVSREYMSPASAIDLIHSVDGLAILAHPLMYHLSEKALDTAAASLTALGLDGLETWYSSNLGNDLQRMKKLADKYGLLYSGGSDFHGSNKPLIKIGRGRGKLFIPYDIISAHKEALRSKADIRPQH